MSGQMQFLDYSTFYIFISGKEALLEEIFNDIGACWKAIKWQESGLYFSHLTLLCRYLSCQILLERFYASAASWTGFSYPGEETGVCQRGGKTYSVGAVWKENCNKTTCECTPTGARCAGVSCGQFGCGPGFVYGPPDACGCPGPCVRKKNIMATFFYFFEIKYRISRC